MLQRFLLFWLVLSCAGALCWPSLWDMMQRRLPAEVMNRLPLDFDPLLTTLADGSAKPRFDLGLIVALTMFSIGTLLTGPEVQAVVRRWPLVLAGTTIQYVSMPLLAFSLASLFPMSPEMRVGVVLVGCVPGAMASNVLTLAARGNISYSVSLTTVATLLSPLVVPLALSVTLGAATHIDAAAISLKLVREVVGPVLLGHLLCRQSATLAQVMQRWGRPIANLSILLIIATVVAANRERLGQMTGIVLVVLLLLNILGYLAGYVGAKCLRLDAGMRRALSLEVGMQNAGVGTSLAMGLFEPASAIPTAAYTFGCMLTGTLLAQWWGRSEPRQVPGSQMDPDSLSAL